MAPTGEAKAAAVHHRVQGRSGQAAAGRRQGAGRGRDGARPEPRAAERLAQRAPGGGLGGGVGRPQGRAGRGPAAAARGEAARGGGRDPQEGRGFLRPGDRVSNFVCVAAERANHAVATLCRVVGASVSGFYAWLRAIPLTRARADAEAELRGLIGRIFAVRRRAYGSRRVHAELRREGGRPSRRRGERLVREMGLQARRGRRRPPRTTDSRHDLPVAPNLLDRNFAVERPDTVWLADISYLPTDEGWMYLAAIEDLATREIVGWSMADHLRAGLCVDALVMALQRRRPESGLVHHSDRGAQGGFKWSTQHLDQGGCGGPSKAAFGSVRARRVAVPGPPLRGAAGGSAPVLGVDRGGTLERGRRSWRRRGAGSGDTLVPGGGRHATVTSLAVVEAAVRAPSVVCGAGGDRDLAGSRAWRAGDRSPAGAGAVHDLPRAAPQRCHAWRRPGIQGHDRAMAR